MATLFKEVRKKYISIKKCFKFMNICEDFKEGQTFYNTLKTITKSLVFYNMQIKTNIV